MPFLKPHLYRLPLSRQKEVITLKSGLRHAIFSVPKDKYVGDWRLDKKGGKGLYLTRSDRLYEGDFDRGYRHGFGVLSTRLPNQTYESQYIGDWRNGWREGYGVCYYPDGGYYEGTFKRGKRHGHGRYWAGDGSFYEGRWEKDKYHGVGIFVQTNGNRYEGEWCNGVKHGRGIFYHLDSGQKQQGVWQEGVSVCSTMVDIYYRQSGWPPSQYPVQQGKLKDPESVYIDRENSALERIDQLKPPDFDSAIRALRLIVWADQVVAWD